MNDQLAPRFKIEINGRDLADTAPVAFSSIKRVMFEQAFFRTSRVEISFRDSENFDLAPELTKLHSRLNLRMGYHGRLCEMFEGSLAGIEPSCEQGEPPTLVLKAYDYSHKLKVEPPNRIYKDNNLDNVVRKIIASHKDPALKAEIERDSKLKAILPETDQRVVQVSMTDWEVLAKAARLVNYKLFVEFDTVYLVSSDYLRKSSGIRYIYNARKPDIEADKTAPILSFYPRLGFEDQRKTVEVVGWDAYKAKGIRYSKAELEQIEKDSDLEGYTEISVIASEKLVVNEVAKTDKQARDMAEAELRRRAEQLVRGDLTIIGDPEIELGEMLALKINAFGRIGRQFSGEHQVAGIRNIITSTGYITEIDINRQGLTEVS